MATVTGTLTIDGAAVPFQGNFPDPAPGKDGAPGQPGVSPSAASVAAALAATPSFVAAVAKAVGGPPPPPPPPPTGGFAVKAGKLYDPNGVEFRIRGVDRDHYDSSASTAGIAKSGANTVRFGMYLDSLIANYIPVLKAHVASKVVPIVTMFSFPDNTGTVGGSDPAEIAAAATWWAANVTTFRAALGKNCMINLANEWGPRGSTVWRDAMIAAIATIRASGETGVIWCDTGGFGQDLNDLGNYSPAVFNSDPLKNVAFSLHVYNAYNDLPTLNAAFAQLNALSASVGMVFGVLEFGPGPGVGVSSQLTATQVIQACEAANIPWCAWAWDDSAPGFGMTKNPDGTYNTAADLTPYGTAVVAQLQALAKPATSV
jgi:Cellulase (glycosyl hydrolase family 5)